MNGERGCSFSQSNTSHGGGKRKGGFALFERLCRARPWLNQLIVSTHARTHAYAVLHVAVQFSHLNVKIASTFGIAKFWSSNKITQFTIRMLPAYCVVSCVSFIVWHMGANIMGISGHFSRVNGMKGGMGQCYVRAVILDDFVEKYS